MKHVIITQARNESIRLENWIAYYASQGIDSIIFFDDYSTDSTDTNLHNLCHKYKITLDYNKTDGSGHIFDTGNSELYGGDQSCNHRIIRSLSHGIMSAKQTYGSCVCYCIDVDEYVVSNSKDSISKVTESIFQKLDIERIYCHSFDIAVGYDLNEWITKQIGSCYRWSYDSRQKSIFKHRGKSIFISDFIDSSLSLANNVVHDLGNKVSDKEDYREYDNLRIHHFRKPPLVDPRHTISFEEDTTLYQKSSSL
jgi:hypothetical protein